MKLESLKTLRKAKGLSRRELAEKSGVNQDTIRVLESGINDPMNIKLSTLIALCKALGCKAKHLFPNEKCL